MTTFRKIVFRNEQIYHVFNRGVERRTVFTNRKELERAKQLIKFYRHKDIPIRFSQVMNQPEEIKNKILEKLYRTNQQVDIISYCLMPNHFHFILKQNTENGVARFISNFTNAYTKYFNTKHKRIGPLFQGIFKALIVETDKQLIHLSRYIHLNPVSSSIIKEDQLTIYPYSSLMEYLLLSNDEISKTDVVLSMFKTSEKYRDFVINQLEYAKRLDEIKHLVLE